MDTIKSRVISSSFAPQDGYFLLPAALCHDIVNVSESEGAQPMKKYAILREFFPWNLFAPPISEKFLAMSVPPYEAAEVTPAGQGTGCDHP